MQRFPSPRFASAGPGGWNAAAARRSRADLVGVALLLSLAGAACGDGAPAESALSSAVDSVLPRLEALAGLEALAPVRIARRDSAELRRYVASQLARELPPQELEGIQASYAAFGLIPDTLDLRRLLLDLYSEQVLGYYDPTTDTLYVMEGVPREALRPVLTHELVHALQDQYVNLDSLVSAEYGNDRQTAAQAAIEGHATLVMFALLAEQRLGAPLDMWALPDLREQLRPALEAQNQQFPVFRSAPRVIQESLLFPYLQGAGFVQALWRAGVESSLAKTDGEHPPPFGDLLPVSTEQVLHPQAAFLQGRDAPAALELRPSVDERASTPSSPSLPSVASGAREGGDTTARRGSPGRPSWQVLYENTLGEFEVRILLAEHLGGRAEALATGWDGDRYRLLEGPGGERALVWYSVWDNADAADNFADAYRRILARRTDRRGRVERLEAEGRPVVRVVDAPRAVSIEGVPVPRLAQLRTVER